MRRRAATRTGAGDEGVLAVGVRERSAGASEASGCVRGAVRRRGVARRVDGQRAREARELASSRAPNAAARRRVERRVEMARCCRPDVGLQLERPTRLLREFVDDLDAVFA